MVLFLTAIPNAIIKKVLKVFAVKGQLRKSLGDSLNRGADLGMTTK